MNRIYLGILSLLFALIALLPIVSLLFGSLGFNSTVEGNAYSILFKSRTFCHLLNTIGIGATVSTFCTFLGFILGFILSKTALPQKRLFKVLLLIPLFLPPYIFAVAWVDLFVLSGLSPQIIYSSKGAIFVLTIIYTPIAILIFSNALQHINASMEEAALLMAPYRKVVFSIILPLIKPAVFSSFLLIFILAIAEFSVPAFLSVQVLTTDIFTQFSAFYNYNTAIVQSGILILFCVVGLLVESFYLADRPYLTVGNKSQLSILVSFSRQKRLMLAIVVFYILLSTFLPIILLTIQALSEGMQPLFKAFLYLQTEMWQSLLYGSMGAFILVVIAFGFAYLKGKRTWGVVDFMLILSFALPSVVTGIALIKFYNTPLLNFIYAGPLIILIAYLMRYLFITEKIIHNRLAQIPKSYELAALISGANRWSVIRKIVLPLAAEALLGAFIISFIFCIGELGTAIMVYPPGTSLLPIKIFTIMANAPQSLTSAMCLVALLFTGAVISCLFFLWYLLKRASVIRYGRG
jgi:iron(III) transport system permease protein